MVFLLLLKTSLTTRPVAWVGHFMQPIAMMIRRGIAALVLSLLLRAEASNILTGPSSVAGPSARGEASAQSGAHDASSHNNKDNARSSLNNGGNRTPPTGGIVQPLLPHHALLERRRRELRSLGLSEEEAEAEMTSLRRDLRGADGDRPHTYPRKRMDAMETTVSGEQRSLADIEHQQIGALYQGYGTHYVDVWVGTPPQRQTVIVDTGSGVTAFPCASCNDCGESYHTDGYFVEADSSTFQKLDCDSPCFRGRCSGSGSTQICRISMSYQEGSSWSAYEAVDVCYAGGPHDEPLKGDATPGDGLDPKHASNFAFPLTFGCQTSLTGLFRTQLADGIMGMDNANAAFWKQMYDKNAVPEQKFSLCFNRQPVAAKDGTMAGAVTLGGEDPRLHTSPMVFSDNTRSSGFYTVRLKKMYIREGGGESAYIKDDDKIRPIDIDEATLNSGGVIVDSGTTDTYMTRRLAEPFKRLWEEVAGRKYTHDAITLTDEQLRSLPTVMFQLEGSRDGANDNMPSGFDGTGLAAKLDPSNPKDVLIAMPASHYMEYDVEKNNYVSRLYLEEGSGSVLGANAMMGHDVLFDIDNKRIGWAESECDYFAMIGVETPAIDHHPEKVDSEKLAEEGFEDVTPGEGDGTATGSEIAEAEKGKWLFVTEAEDFVERACPSTGCKAGIAFGLIGMIVVFVAYSRYRSSRYGIESLPLENADLDLQEEGSSGASSLSGYHDRETEMTGIGGKDDDDDDDNDPSSSFSIT